MTPRTAIGRNRQILASTLAGVLRGAVQNHDEFRYGFVREIWTACKRFGANGIQNVDFADLPWLWSARVLGYVDDPQRPLIAALAAELHCETFFEIGTSLGRTTWMVAHHNPGLAVLTLDMPLGQAADSTRLEIGADDAVYFRPPDACGEAFRDTPEAASITQLWGDSATFDFSPYAGTIDLVYVDGAHSYDYVASDTRTALALLAPGGTIIWDDYVSSPGVYAYLTEHSSDFDRPIHHVVGTRMAIYSRQDLVSRRDLQYPFAAP